MLPIADDFSFVLEYSHLCSGGASRMPLDLQYDSGRTGRWLEAEVQELEERRQGASGLYNRQRGDEQLREDGYT